MEMFSMPMTYKKESIEKKERLEVSKGVEIFYNT